jgi:hypothetical protein
MTESKLIERPKKFTITLSDRAPVSIAPDEWPQIAAGKTFWGGKGLECQANEVGWIRVRQHGDGRTIVYCDRDRGTGGMHLGYRGASGGFLLPAGTTMDEIVRAIRRCAGIIDAPELGDECIGDLPAEEL